MKKEQQKKSSTSSEVVKNLLKVILSSFSKKRLTVVLQFGSSIINLDWRDIDIYILLDSYKPHDLVILKKIKRKFPMCDFVLQWSTEIALNNETFMVGHQGSYMSECFAEAKVIYGKNPFLKKRLFSKKQKKDLVRKVNEYILRLDILYLETEKIKTNKNIFDKYIFRIFIDVGLCLNYVSFFDTNFLDRPSLEDKLFKGKMFSADKIIAYRSFLKDNRIDNYPITIRPILIDLIKRLESSLFKF